MATITFKDAMIMRASKNLEVIRKVAPEFKHAYFSAYWNTDDIAGMCGMLTNHEEAIEIARRAIENWKTPNLGEDELLMGRLLHLP